MYKETSEAHSRKISDKDDLQLPSFPECLESALSSGHSFTVEGTNVIRVPFGVREPRKQRPAKPKRVATLVLPFQPSGSPNPPPQAA